MSDGTRTDSATERSWLEVGGSRYFLDWLAAQQVSLAFSTCQTGKLFFPGRKPYGTLGVFERTCPHGVGLHATPDVCMLWMNPRHQLWRVLFKNAMFRCPASLRERRRWRLESRRPKAKE